MIGIQALGYSFSAARRSAGSTGLSFKSDSEVAVGKSSGTGILPVQFIISSSEVFPGIYGASKRFLVEADRLEACPAKASSPELAFRAFD